jgi:hypothetical protein
VLAGRTRFSLPILPPAASSNQKAEACPTAVNSLSVFRKDAVAADWVSQKDFRLDPFETQATLVPTA